MKDQSGNDWTRKHSLTLRAATGKELKDYFEARLYAISICVQQLGKN